ncbi:MAG TPA: hypothetical protein VJT80_00835 [Steroidobacteraceae bacterium]|nr:hypothetical protein [Steroidobacteraceae bacterium]
MWPTVSTVLNAPFDALFWLVHWLPAEWQVVVLALPGALFALAIYKVVSNQAAIRDAKDKIIAHLLELRLFRDDLRVLLLAEGRVFASIGRYLGHSLLPMVVMLPVFLLLLIQIESRFAFRGLAADEQALVTVGVASSQPVSRLPVHLDAGNGLRVATPALRADSSGEIYWRVHALAPGPHNLKLRIGSEQTDRVVSGEGSPAMTMAYRANDMRTLLYPRVAALPANGPVTTLAIDYPRARGEFAGLSSTSWLFFGMVMMFAFALRRPFGVSF